MKTRGQLLIMQNNGHRRSRSFNVTNFGTNGKPVCDLLRENNSYLVTAYLPRYGGLFVKFSLSAAGGASV